MKDSEHQKPPSMEKKLGSKHKFKYDSKHKLQTQIQIQTSPKRTIFFVFRERLSSTFSKTRK